MMIKGRSISRGRIKGSVFKLKEPLSFLGGVDASTGDVKVENGGNISDRVLVFPRGKGSTVGSFVMYDLKVHGKAPSAIINSSAETIVATGAVISSIPMVDKINVDLLKDGDEVVVDATEGTVDIINVRCVESVSSVVIIDGKIMMLRRPATARSFPDVWSLCAGKIEKDELPHDAAIREIMEETEIVVGEPIASLKPVFVRENSTIWKVYPFMFRADGAVPRLNNENVSFRMFDLKELQEESLVPLTMKVITEMMDNVE